MADTEGAKRRPATVVATAMLIAGSLWLALNLLGNWSTFLSSVPAPLRPYLQNTTAPWVLLFVCFCVLWWELKHPSAPIDGVLYREYMKLRDEKDREIKQLREDHSALIDRLGTNIPRSVSADQDLAIKTIILHLTRFDKKDGFGRVISVLSVPGVHDSETYAEQIRQTLRAAGIQCDHHETAVHPNDAPEFRTGIALGGWDNKCPMTQDVIAAALWSAKIPFRTLAPRRGSRGVHLIVGGRDVIGEAKASGDERSRRIDRVALMSSMQDLRNVAGAELRKHSYHIYPAPTVHDSGVIAAEIKQVFEGIGVRPHMTNDTNFPRSDYPLHEFGIWVIGNSERDIENQIAATFRQVGWVTNVADVVVHERHPPYDGFDIVIAIGNDGSSLVDLSSATLKG